MFNLKNRYTVVACVNNNGVIGKDGELLFRIKADLQNFKSLTESNVVIMGRSTFESLGMKPLKNRINIVLTSNKDFMCGEYDEEEYKDTYICNSLEEADNLCYSYFPDRELFVIGGGSVYQQVFDCDAVEKAIVTLINDDQDGDAYFPEIEKDDRYKVIFKTMSLRDHPNDIYYRYVVYKRKK